MNADSPECRLAAELAYHFCETAEFSDNPDSWRADLHVALDRLDRLLWSDDHRGVFGDGYIFPGPITFHGRPFWSEGDLSACWHWSGKVNQFGYATCPIAYTVHRAMFKIFYPWEKLSKEDQLHHRCENKRCINPHHLESVTEERHREIHGIPEDES